MKIRDILNESTDIEKLANNIVNSKYYNNVMEPILYKHRKLLRSAIEGNDLDMKALVRKIPFLYHGGENRDDVSIVKFTERKQPKDTFPFIHDMVNELLNERFGKPIRNGMFGYKSKRMASGYGIPYLVIPLGEYSYYYKWDIDDFTSTYMTAQGEASGSGYVQHLFDSVIDDFPYYIIVELTDVHDYDIDYDALKNFDEIYEEVIHVFDKVVANSKLSASDADNVKQSIPKILKHTIAASRKELADYASTVRETKTIEAVDKEEIIMWFDTAYFIDPNSHIFHDVMKYILTNKI